MTISLRLRMMAVAVLTLTIPACGGMMRRDGGEGVPPPPRDVKVVDETLWHPDPDTDLRPADQAAEDENEPPFETGHLPTGDELTLITEDNKKVPSLGFSSTQRTKIRTATFNSHLMGGQRALQPVPEEVRKSVDGPKGLTIGQFPFAFARDASVHVMGVQEALIVQSKVSTAVDWEETDDITGHPLLNAQGDGEYAVLLGEPVFIYTITFPKDGKLIVRERIEYCPVIYNKDVLDCGGDTEMMIDEPATVPLEAIRKQRHAHRVECTIKRKPDTVEEKFRKFAFYCAHFAARRPKNLVNIPKLQTMLASATNVVVAADFNSNPAIGGQVADAYRLALNLQPAGPRSYKLPEGGFTKILLDPDTDEVRPRKGRPQDEPSRFLDDVLWSQELDPPTRPMNLRRFVVSWGNELIKHQAWFQQYIEVSDHMPVIKDFEF